MKCLNLYAVYGDGPAKNQKGASLTHYPVFQDDAGVQYINLKGKFVPLAANRKNFIRIENAALGN